jgi:hypothetical protein
VGARSGGKKGTHGVTPLQFRQVRHYLAGHPGDLRLATWLLAFKFREALAETHH